MAVKMGEAHEEGDAGWFSVPKRTWALPPQLTPIALVGHLTCSY